MIWKAILDDWRSNTETLFAEFSCCGRMSMLCRTETGSAWEIHCRYADVLEMYRTDNSSTS